MKRREFLGKTVAALGACSAAGPVAIDALRAVAGGQPRFRWQRPAGARLFTGVWCDGQPLVGARSPGVLNGRCRLWGPLSIEPLQLGPQRPAGRQGPLIIQLGQKLHDTGSGCGQDVLEATVTIRNDSSSDQRIEAAFETTVQPALGMSPQEVYVPLNAAGLSKDQRFAALGVNQFRQDCNLSLDQDAFQCHYLEPMASYPDQRTTRALLLAPVVDIHASGRPWHVALFTVSDQPVRFTSHVPPNGGRAWEVGRVLDVPAGKTVRLRCWLYLHRGDAAAAWKAFHRYGHREDHPPIEWIRTFKVHYYDFLSSAAGRDGRRGDGYDADLPCFRTFHVGMATQHGYYPTLGDYIRPDRKTWLAMQGDKHGPVEMSFDKMRERIRAARTEGARAAIYIHPVLLDDATPCFEKLKDCVLADEQGRPVPYPWQGPDTAGRNWRASLASTRWRAHLLQQSEWILDILRPDALVVDETFAGLGYEHHPDRAGPMSAAAIDWFHKLRTLARSYGPEIAVFSSDCSMSPFVLWLDGEVGDHAYGSLLGHPLYRQQPVRYLAALGDKPWRPCAWHFRRMWKHQMALARQVGSGVGVSNGWLEYTGLHGLSQSDRRRLIADILSRL